MREFMHYITNSFFSATGWNEDNSYKELNAAARGKALGNEILLYRTANPYRRLLQS
jgi:hypothetical protein